MLQSLLGGGGEEGGALHPMGSHGAAFLRRIGGWIGVLVGASSRGGPLALGDRFLKPAVRRRWLAAVLGGLAALRRGSE